MRRVRYDAPGGPLLEQPRRRLVRFSSALEGREEPHDRPRRNRRRPTARRGPAAKPHVLPSRGASRGVGRPAVRLARLRGDVPGRPVDHEPDGLGGGGTVRAYDPLVGGRTVTGLLPARIVRERTELFAS
ncbi:hypothetical protein ACIHFB_16940 [Streptomyces sp. NPDC051963]|uniref:hypothetical protein n=1 Tax=Streptomyces sp. NPDC051963 TaxID=3365678 RepID=UPI0037CCCCD5